LTIEELQERLQKLGFTGRTKNMVKADLVEAYLSITQKVNQDLLKIDYIVEKIEKRERPSTLTIVIAEIAIIKISICFKIIGIIGFKCKIKKEKKSRDSRRER
jgi:hypothetical protein